MSKLREYQKTYAIEFSDDDWEEIQSLSFEPFEFDVGDELTRGQWMAIAHMCIGKAVQIKKGRYDMDDGQNTRLKREWTRHLNEIADTILEEFQPGDGKL